MKYSILIAAFLFSSGLYSQRMTKASAKDFMEQSWVYITTKDSVAFAKLWSLDDKKSINHKRPHSTDEVYDNFRAVSEWLDTAVSNTLSIEFVEIEKHNLLNTDTKYWIKAWFKYNENFFKGYGFYLGYHNNEWKVRDYVSTSTMNR